MKKYKITNISEPTNEFEKQRAKDAKSFNIMLLTLVSSTISSTFGAANIMLNIANGIDIYGIIFNATLCMCTTSITAFSVKELIKLYAKKGNEQQLNEENELSGGKSL